MKNKQENGSLHHQSLDLGGSYESDNGESTARLAELLMDPSKMRRPGLAEEREMEREREGEARRKLLAAPGAGLSRWASDSAVSCSNPAWCVVCLVCKIIMC